MDKTPKKITHLESNRIVDIFEGVNYENSR